jgi:hypothetical protein
MQPADDGGSARTARSRQLRRYGPLAGIVVLLLVVVAVVVIGGGDDSDDTSGEAANATGVASFSEIGDAAPGAPDPTGEMPVTYKEADESGNVDDQQWPDTCDTERGTVKIPSVYALPCVPEFDGDNGGATSTGVTADAIKVVYYVPQQGADLNSILGGMGVNDTIEQREQTLNDYVEVFSSVAQTYGRKVEVVRFDATGAGDDVVASRADAIDIIAMKPFAVIGGAALDRGTFAQELADGHVLCFGCTTALPDNMILDMAPYIWGGEPAPQEFLGMLATYINAGLGAGLGDNAEFAGDDLKDQPRKVGVIHFEQDPPLYTELAQEQHANFGKETAITESYVFDIPTLPAKAAELIAQYKSEGITTIMFFGDPLMPGYLMDAASDQEYFPEWIFTGTALTDTNVMGRQWNSDQVKHAFGMSQIAVPTEQDLQGAITLYRWYFGGDDTMPPSANFYALLAPPAQWLLAGIHMAGPDLTPETFARGLFRIPPAGGGPANPQVSYGNWGVFPEMDYLGVDDAVEVWWDPTVQAEDERGQMGTGVWRRSAGGERFTIGDDPAPAPFTDVDESVTVLDTLADEDKPPDYPPPSGSPAATG